MAQQEGGLQKSGYPSELFTSQAVGQAKTSSECSSVFSETFLLQVRGQVLLFNSEGRGLKVHSTLPKSRLLNYYFLGSRGRSQQTRPAPLLEVGLKSPWVGTTASAKLSIASIPLHNLLKPLTDIFKYVRCGLKTWSLSRVGSIIPSMEMRG